MLAVAEKVFLYSQVKSVGRRFTFYLTVLAKKKKKQWGRVYDRPNFSFHACRCALYLILLVAPGLM